MVANKPAPSISYFTPSQVPAAGTAFDPQPDERPIPTLFQPLTIRGVTFHNRIFVSAVRPYGLQASSLRASDHSYLLSVNTPLMMDT